MIAPKIHHLYDRAVSLFRASKQAMEYTHQIDAIDACGFESVLAKLIRHQVVTYVNPF